MVQMHVLIFCLHELHPDRQLKVIPALQAGG